MTYGKIKSAMNFYVKMNINIHLSFVCKIDNIKFIYNNVAVSTLYFNPYNY